MDSVAIWFDGTDRQESIDRRILRDCSNILGLSDKRFIKNFRLNKEAFIYVLNSVQNELPPPQRSTSIQPITKLAATLKFLGQGGYQHQIGQDAYVAIAQQSMSRCLFEVCSAIERVLCPRHINFHMSESEKRNAKNYFFMKSGIPGTIGVVDGTHIQFIRPSHQEHLYFNRKLKHSINAMVICDHEMFIRAVNGRYGGASHDSHVWNLSSERSYLKTKFENGERGTWILGDSGYPLEPWILTPYRNASENSAECIFNEKFSKSRSLIERVFGVLKGRFRCLLAARELHYSPQKVAKILNACCALHNICTLYKVEIPSIIQEEAIEINFNVGMEDNNSTNVARNIRNEIKNSLIA